LLEYSNSPHIEIQGYKLQIRKYLKNNRLVAGKRKMERWGEGTIKNVKLREYPAGSKLRRIEKPLSKPLPYKERGFKTLVFR
jgi:hypothetical protein